MSSLSGPVRGEDDALLELALRVAREAGALLLAGREALREVGSKSSPTDAVTEMDTTAERLIVERLLAARPDDGLLGEEGTAHEGTSGVRWVIDPLDGTVNYLYRLPNWAVSVAAERDGVAVAGVVYDPSHQVAYTATRGGGAFRDGVALACSTQSALAEALVCTGFGYAATTRAAQARVVAEVLPRVRDIRRFGSAALDLCLVAGGRVDAYFEYGLNPWDLAAGGLIAAEAGCRVGGLRGRPPGRFVLAAPPRLFGALEEVLAGMGADQV